MKTKIIFCILFILCLKNCIYAQSNTHCGSAYPICSETPYNFQAPINTFAEIGPNYGCLLTQPNPIWVYLKIINSGVLMLEMQSATGQDIDFAAWGPFYSAYDSCISGLSANCDTCPSNNTDTSFIYPSGNLVDCNYEISSSEVCHISNALTGQYYLIMITNKSNVPNTIFVYQNNSSDTSATSFCDSLQTSDLYNRFEDSNVKFYPNPTQKTLNIKFEKIIGEITITIIDLMGIKLIETTSFDKETQLDLTNLENGYYFVKCKNGNKLYTGKFALKK